MKTLHYKTLKGLLKQTANTQVTAEQLFNKRIYIRGAWRNIELSEEAQNEACKLFANYCVKTKNRALDMAYRLKYGYGDFSLFQGFYFELSKNNEVFISNSLSGEAFNYCVITYLKRYC